jgi:aryl-alcohol dehydrogenase-like predicted oxidoreductase
MYQRALGTSGMAISPIGLGTWAIGGWMWGGQDDTASIDAIHAAVESGVNWIDTAPIYGSGHSEEVVGRALAGLPASRRPYVFTKFGLGDDSAANIRSASRASIMAECDASLRRLGVDCIDLYQLHWPAPEPVEETAAACAQLLAAGKIRAIGVSNFTVAQLDEWMATGVPLHALQAPFSILRPAARTELLPWCADNGVGVIAYSPLFRGMLFGTWPRDKTFPAGDARGTHKDYSGPRFQRHLDAIDELRPIAADTGLSVAQLCVGVLLRTPGLTGCIVGARNPEQGAALPGLAAEVTDAQADGVWAVVSRLQRDLEGM